jgi:dynein heavy chain
LGELEAGLLKQLAESKGDILDDIELIESLEYSKKLSVEINEKMEKGKITEEVINVTSENYRPAASRGALVFFLLNELYKIHSFYKFSLDSFIIVVKRAIKIVADRMKKQKAPAEEGEEGEEPAEGEEPPPEEEEAEMTPGTLKNRVLALVESITY